MNTVKTLNQENTFTSGKTFVKDQQISYSVSDRQIRALFLENAGKRGQFCEEYSFTTWEDKILLINYLFRFDFNISKAVEGLEFVKSEATVIYDDKVIRVYKSLVKATEVINPFNNENDKYRSIKPRVTDKFQVGSIVYNSWGYDQTNIDFYCIVEMTEKTVRMLPMSSERGTEVGFMSNKVVPSEIDFNAKSFIKKYNEGYINMRHGYCSLYDSPLIESHYA